MVAISFASSFHYHHHHYSLTQKTQNFSPPHSHIGYFSDLDHQFRNGKPVLPAWPSTCFSVIEKTCSRQHSSKFTFYGTIRAITCNTRELGHVVNDEFKREKTISCVERPSGKNIESEIKRSLLVSTAAVKYGVDLNAGNSLNYYDNCSMNRDVTSRQCHFATNSILYFCEPPQYLLSSRREVLCWESGKMLPISSDIKRELKTSSFSAGIFVVWLLVVKGVSEVGGGEKEGWRGLRERGWEGEECHSFLLREKKKIVESLYF
ncbi:hypothetical protein B566_EDAN002618 [Ephemera danica]|nr:hypothetical protein B566_EDAN002618 [Ephemera danica]